MAFKNQLALFFDNQPAKDLISHFQNYACVAMLLRGVSMDTLEMGFILRAASPLDRWSGQLAFPGGRRDDTDTNDLFTALRETREEIGLELRAEDLIGRLDDVQARRHGERLDFFIRAFVFYLDREFTLKMDAAEVADFFWFPVKDLVDPARLTQVQGYPGVNLRPGPPLWGLTLLMTSNFLDLCRLTPQDRPLFKR